MAGRNDYIASIDIGTDKIAVLLAEKEDDDRLRIIGYNISPSDGVRKGSISAIDPLSRAISKALDQIQKSFWQKKYFQNSRASSHRLFELY